MDIIFVASNYRTEKRQVHVFLDNVVRKIADRGINCVVIAPQSWQARLRRPQEAREPISRRTTENGTPYTVYTPTFNLFPPKKIGSICLGDFSKKSYFRALKRTVKKHGLRADVVYSHFIQAGAPAVMLARWLGVPSFIACGEADTIAETNSLSRKLLRRTLTDATGLIAVSSKNRDELRTLYGSDEILRKVRVLVNAVDSTRFYRKDKLACREKLGFDRDAFIVSYTGSFIKRKGTRLLSDVLDRFDDAYSIFIGVGEDGPVCRNILHKGRVDNAAIADYLCASDVFVLPTLAEGCCNAIVEAVACGVPAISSDRPFNYDVLDETNAILIEPTDADALYRAIEKLKEEPQTREKMAAASLERAKGLSLDVRVDKILDFIGDSVKKQ